MLPILIVAKGLREVKVHMKMKKILKSLLYSLILALIILPFTGTSVKVSAASAADYGFVQSGTSKPVGSEYEIKQSSTTFNITGTLEPTATIQWSTSQKKVVDIDTNTSNPNSFVTLLRKGPGYSTITATIKQSWGTINISFAVKVGLAFDAQRSGLTTITTTDNKVLLLDSNMEPAAPLIQKRLYLKYVTEDNTEPTTDDLDDVVEWKSSNIGVATVDETGMVTVVGAGTATITVTSKTWSTSDKAMVETIPVVVKPHFNLTIPDSTGQNVTHNSTADKNQASAIVTGVPVDFTINSSASLGTNLKWVVYDNKGNSIKEGDSTLMSYNVSDISGNVTFRNVKAGSYEIYAYSDAKYIGNTNIPYAYMKIVVPIVFNNLNLVMTVGDTYNLIANSNITGVNMFTAPVYVEGSQNTALLDTKNYVITAKRNGTVTIKLSYNTTQNQYGDETVVDDIIIHIRVIDGIALSTSDATIYTKGTLQLNAIVTDSTYPIVWSSSDPKVATVENGLVTGLTKGTTTITAQQNINGIVKSATCKITVQQSVTSIVLDPAKLNLAIGESATITATVTPKDLSNINLQWRSSDTSVVVVTNPYALTAVIKGVAGGTAVITAINQDNVVVGYCHVTVRQPVTSIILSETSAIVSMSSKYLQLRASVYPVTAMNKEVLWSSTDTKKATVDANGRVTFIKSGTVTIIATSADNPAVTAMCNLTIDVPVVSIALDETTKTMYVGETARLTYVLLPVNAANTGVTWTSTNTSVVTVDASGKVTAKSVGTATIILKTSDGAYSAYCNITVRSVATGVKLDLSDLKLKVGEYYVFKKTLTPANSTDNELIWESSDTKIAIVDNEGKVTGKGAGSAIIMVRTVAGAVAYCKVTVTQPVQGLLLNFSEKTIFVGNKFTLEVSITPSNASQLGVTWKSSNEKVATVNSKGEITAIKGGSAVIYCTTVDGGLRDTCVILVREPVTTVKLNYSSYRLGKGRSLNLVAKITTESATNPGLVWKSSNPSVATVNQKGKVTGIKNGYTTITATTTDGSDVEASATIRVVTPVSSLSISTSYMTMFVGDARTIKATLKPSNATFKTAKWTSSNKSIAIVDEKGVVTALKDGEVTITASAMDNSGKKAICVITVNKRVPATGITLQDKKITLVARESKIVSVVLAPANADKDITWSSDSPAVATVDKKTGRIVAKSPGTAYITAMTGSGKTATIEVIVIGLNITSLTLEQYTTMEYPLVVEGATSTVKWSIDNPKIAIVTNGRVSTRAVGTATITAMVNGSKLTCKLRVTKIS